ncbi:MAG: Ig-like domain-containing protein [Clostridia bacterium]|nr:Ig-like domain-containing protein [Clostridia bacterium]
MNNEEKNISAENEAVEENNNPAPAPAKKLSGGVIGAIIGGVAVVIIAIILLVTLLPGNNSNPGGEQSGGENAETKITYTVTVVDQDGNPIPGAKVAFAANGGTAIPFPTNAEGKATYKSDKTVTATVTEIPVGYEYDKLNVAQTLSSETLTVTITKLAPLVIKVVDKDGNPISGVTVQMCDSAGSCRIPITTGEDGTASYNYEEGDFHAQLTVVPDGYTVDDLSAYYDFVDGVATIELTKVD